MKNSNLHPLPLTLSIVAIILSIYSLYEANGFNFILPKENDVQEASEVGGSDEPAVEVELPEDLSDFEKQVFETIDKYIAQKEAEAVAQAQAEAEAASQPVDASEDDDPVLGNDNAPITMIEFSDYECPYCKRYFTDSFPQIKKNYIDTGKIKYVFRDYPLPIHPNAIAAANAAECIRDQGGDDMYFEYHDLLFGNQTTLSPETYKDLANNFSIDQDEFATCVDDEKFADEIAQDYSEGSAYGVRGTPGFFINGVPVAGAQPYQVFEQVIEAQLAEE